MGDRGNICILSDDGKPAIFFYTHWRGSDIKQSLAKSLIRGKSRWGDDAYLNRIIFQDLLDGDDDLTGFGISTSMPDNEHDVLYVNHLAQTVAIGNPEAKSVKFEKFATQYGEKAVSGV